MKSTIRSTITQKLSRVISSAPEPQFTSIGGGCINECFRIDAGKNRLFCKVNSVSKYPQLFQKEKNGLQLIASQDIIRTPRVIDVFENDDHQVIILEWIAEGERNQEFWKKFGEQLAQLHQVSRDEFGLDHDNFMGSVHQSNTPSCNWIEFFTLQRLRPLMRSCRDKQLLKPQLIARFENLFIKLNNIFPDKQKPALLHGDLWSGNFMCNERSEPVLIDPAVYFGHASADLGMTTLFGGFHRLFYESYQYHQPFTSNYKEQWEVANLYPLLIHLLLFGSSYLGSIETTLSHFD